MNAHSQTALVNVKQLNEDIGLAITCTLVQPSQAQYSADSDTGEIDLVLAPQGSAFLRALKDDPEEVGRGPKFLYNHRSSEGTLIPVFLGATPEDRNLGLLPLKFTPDAPNFSRKLAPPQAEDNEDEVKELTEDTTCGASEGN
ncbi:hypothetical protein P154DRAFT_530798 [Amniculicola lignicola CBS 123094]|uniref:Uncharacterized protein n=1 Tax=Amniculicola lignicola CBS 123094 TaxID=1392246 RepID=A0A6A5WU61_9PLEO|nr:hypothetical protein P154DRAFT_530798 [Amniculicola lignicola CBS 123094]